MIKEYDFNTTTSPITYKLSPIAKLYKKVCSAMEVDNPTVITWANFVNNYCHSNAKQIRLAIMLHDIVNEYGEIPNYPIINGQIEDCDDAAVWKHLKKLYEKNPITIAVEKNAPICAVYIGFSADSQLIKIGSSDNLYNRVKQYRYDSDFMKHGGLNKLYYMEVSPESRYFMEDSLRAVISKCKYAIKCHSMDRFYLKQKANNFTCENMYDISLKLEKAQNWWNGHPIPTEENFLQFILNEDTIW